MSMVNTEAPPTNRTLMSFSAVMPKTCSSVSSTECSNTSVNVLPPSRLYDQATSEPSYWEPSTILLALAPENENVATVASARCSSLFAMFLQMVGCSTSLLVADVALVSAPIRSESTAPTALAASPVSLPLTMDFIRSCMGSGK